MVKIQHLTVVLLILSLLGVATSIWAYRDFNLRVWKETMYFFVGGLTVFTVSELTVYITMPSQILIQNILELTAMIAFTYGILKIKQAANLTGA